LDYTILFLLFSTATTLQFPKLSESESFGLAENGFEFNRATWCKQVYGNILSVASIRL
jgi:hypothetical protein